MDIWRIKKTAKLQQDTTVKRVIILCHVLTCLAVVIATIGGTCHDGTRWYEMVHAMKFIAYFVVDINIQLRIHNWCYWPEMQSISLRGRGVADVAGRPRLGFGSFRTTLYILKGPGARARIHGINSRSWLH